MELVLFDIGVFNILTSILTHENCIIDLNENARGVCGVDYFQWLHFISIRHRIQWT